MSSLAAALALQRAENSVRWTLGGRHRDAYVRSVDVIREATAADVPAIAALYRSLSPESTLMRFSGAPPSAKIDRIAALRRGMYSVIGLHGDRVAGEARWCADGGPPPEIAVTVADDHQGYGLGARLLQALRTAARERGFDRLSAMVRTDNLAMIRLLQKIGCVVVEPVQDGVVMFEIGSDDLMPPWGPPDGRRRVLVESRALFDDEATERLRASGFDVRRCLVGRAGRRFCPLVSLGRCRAAEGADVVACLLPSGEFEAAAIAASHESAHRLAATSMPEWRRAVPGLIAEDPSHENEGRPTEST